MRKIKNYANKITELLKDYKNKIDSIEDNYKSQLKKNRQTAESMRGKWTDDYIREYIVNNSPDAEYKITFDTVRKKIQPQINFYISLIEKSIDRYFNQPANQDIINKATAVNNLGIRLTDEEFKMLEKQASTYFDFRIISQLAESRTKEQVVHRRKGEEVVAAIEEVPDSYIFTNLPTIDGLKIGFGNYKREVNFMIDAYSGKDGALYSLLDDKSIEQFNALAADSYINNGAEEKFLNVLSPYLTMCEKTNIKRILTENDKAVIDSITNNTYVGIETKVKEICKNSPELAELFLLDERYEKYAAKALLDA